MSVAELAEQRARPVTDASRYVARAAGCRIEADECESEPDGERAGDGDGTRRESSRGKPHPEHGTAGCDDDEAAAVRACLAPADGDEGEHGDGNEPAQAEGRPREQA